jgi:hypothetical protein
LLAQPVDQPLFEVLGHRDGDPDAGEQHAGRNEAWDEELDVGDPDDGDHAPKVKASRRSLAETRRSG